MKRDERNKKLAMLANPEDVIDGDPIFTKEDNFDDTEKIEKIANKLMALQKNKKIPKRDVFLSDILDNDNNENGSDLMNNDSDNAEDRYDDTFKTEESDIKHNQMLEDIFGATGVTKPKIMGTPQRDSMYAINNMYGNDEIQAKNDIELQNKRLSMEQMMQSLSVPVSSLVHKQVITSRYVFFVFFFFCDFAQKIFCFQVIQTNLFKKIHFHGLLLKKRNWLCLCAFVVFLQH